MELDQTVLYRVPFAIVMRERDRVLVETFSGERLTVSEIAIDLLLNWGAGFTYSEMLQRYTAMLSARVVYRAAGRVSGRLSKWIAARNELADFTSPILLPTEANVRSLIDQLVGVGLLTRTPPADIYRSTILSPSRRVICIPTRDRPQLVKRLLRSIERASRIYGQPITILLGDNSADADNAEKNKQSLQAFCRKTGLQALYAGEEYRRDILAACSKWKDRDASVRFALDSSRAGTYGAARNLLLIAGAGSLALNMDDDTMVSPCTTAKKEGVFCFDGDPTRIEPFSPDASKVPLQRNDFLSAHFSLLGSPVADALSTTSNSVLRACSHLKDHIVGDTGRIAYTLSGAGGDSGMETFTPALKTRAISGSEAYKRLVEARQVHRYFDATYIGHSGGHMGMCFGQDTRSSNIPYFPHGRGEDGVLNEVSKACYPDLFWAYLPNEIWHDPPGTRCQSAHWQQSFAKVRICELLIALIADYGGTTHWPSPSLLTLGKHLFELGCLPHYEWGIILQSVIDAICVGRRGLLLVKLAEPQLFPALRSDFLVALDAIDARLLRRSPLIEEDSKGEVQYWVRSYGRLLIDWPSIVELLDGSAFSESSLSHIIK